MSRPYKSGFRRDKACLVLYACQGLSFSESTIVGATF